MRIGSDNIVLELLAGMPPTPSPTSALVAALPPPAPSPVSSLVVAFDGQLPHPETSFERIDAARRRRLDVRA